LDLGNSRMPYPTGGQAILAAHLPRLSGLAVPHALDFGDLADAPLLGPLRSLRLAGGMGHDGAAEPAGGGGGGPVRPPPLPAPGRLTLHLSSYTPGAVLVALCSSPWVGRLRELHLPSYNRREASCFAPLLEAPASGPTPLHALTLPPGAGLGESLAR